jgi:ribonuclease T2
VVWAFKGSKALDGGTIKWLTRTLSIYPFLTLVLCSCSPSPTRFSTDPAGEIATVNPHDARPSDAPEVQGHRRQRHRDQSGRRAPNTGRAEPGAFDFYVLSLSWSPGFCATMAGQNDPLQCGPERHFAFVLHGLWPQYQQGGWPQNCSNEKVDSSLVNGMLTIMPSPQLVAHEWEKHGTCSGLSPKDYFDEAAEAFHNVTIPIRYQAPAREVVVSPDELHRDFVAANPKIGDQSLVVLCSRNGRYLEEVRACLTEDLDGRPCNGEVLRDACRSNEIVMRPVRVSSFR